MSTLRAGLSLRDTIVRSMRKFTCFSAGVFLFALTTTFGATNVPVPSACTPDVNAQLAKLIQARTRQDVDNVMVCGITTRASRSQRAGRHGGHEILSIRAQL